MLALALVLGGIAWSTEHDLGSPGLTDAFDEQMCVAAAGASGGYLTAWYDDRYSYDYGVVAARLSPTGTLLDPTGFPVCVDAWGTSPPSVASDGTDYLVTWLDSRPDGGIYAARVTAAGAVLPPCGVYVAAGQQLRVPHVAFDGTQYVIAWTNRIDGRVRAARVAVDGTVLDFGGREIAQRSLTEEIAIAGRPPGVVLTWGDSDGGPTRELLFSRVDTALNRLDVPAASNPVPAGADPMLASLTVGAQVVGLVPVLRWTTVGLSWAPPGNFGTTVAPYFPTGQGTFNGRNHVVSTETDAGRQASFLDPVGQAVAHVPLTDAQSYCGDAVASRGSDVLVALDGYFAPGGVGVFAWLLPDGGAPLPPVQLTASAVQAHAFVAAAGATELLLAWGEFPSRQRIAVLRRDGGTSASQLGPEIEDGGGSVVTMTAFRGEYAVAWNTPTGAAVARIDALGQRTTAVMPLPGKCLASSGGDLRTLVLTAGASGMNANFLTLDGGVFTSPSLIGPQPRMATAAQGNASWDVLWVPFGMDVLMLSRVFSDGGADAPNGRVLGLPIDRPQVLLASTRLNSETLAVVSQENRVSGLRIAADGGERLFFDRFLDGGFVEGAGIAPHDGGVLLSWTYYPEAPYEGAWAVRFDGALNLLDAEPFRLVPEPGVRGAVKVAAASGGTRLAYLRYDPATGFNAVRPRHRLMFEADAGAPDAGALPDAGAPDAGAPPDAGTSDAGMPDAGSATPDAGMSDGGATDAGTTEAPALRELAVRCGCGSSGAPLVLLLLLLTAAGSRRSSSSRCR